MAQWFRTIIDLLDDLSLIPSPHMVAHSHPLLHSRGVQ